MRRYLLLSLVVVLSLFTSCEKPESPVSLPAEGGSSHTTISMGPDYRDMLFYDFETNKVVFTSELNSWDLAFESSATGYHIFLNDPKWVVFNTHKKDFSAVNTDDAPADTDPKQWRNDGPCGLPDSTAIGEWKDGALSKGEVYILRGTSDKVTAEYHKMKMQIVAVTSTGYTIMYADIDDKTGKTGTITKNYQTNCSYFSFSSGSEITVEPPKDSWDIVFTQYQHVYYDLGGTPYTVTGALLNPYNTTAGRDTVTNYDKITFETANTLPFTNFRDIIGYNWKIFTLDQAGNGRYTVNQKKCYVIKTRNGQYYKLHFLDFLDPQGVKGYPAFEFDRLR